MLVYRVSPLVVGQEDSPGGGEVRMMRAPKSKINVEQLRYLCYCRRENAALAEHLQQSVIGTKRSAFLFTFPS